MSSRAGVRRSYSKASLPDASLSDSAAFSTIHKGGLGEEENSGNSGRNGIGDGMTGRNAGVQEMRKEKGGGSNSGKNRRGDYYEWN
jgi:hypothetical protein